MPYVNQDVRLRLEGAIHELVRRIKAETRDDGTALWGVLNYTISVLIHGAVIARFAEWRYHLLNSAVGVLESVKLEFYRRVVVPYEDEKIEEAGDLLEYQYPT